MNKQDLIQRFADTHQLPVSQASQMLDTVCDMIEEGLVHGEAIKIRNFGTFQVVKRKEKRFINPQTKNSTVLEEVYYPSFKPSKTLKEKVKKGEKQYGTNTDSYCV